MNWRNDVLMVDIESTHKTHSEIERDKQVGEKKNGWRRMSLKILYEIVALVLKVSLWKKKILLSKMYSINSKWKSALWMIVSIIWAYENIIIICRWI